MKLFSLVIIFRETYAKLLQSANDEEKPLGHCVVIVELSHHLRGLHFKCNYLKMDKIKEIRQELQKELHAFHDSVSLFLHNKGFNRTFMCY